MMVWGYLVYMKHIKYTGCALYRKTYLVVLVGMQVVLKPNHKPKKLDNDRGHEGLLATGDRRGSVTTHVFATNTSLTKFRNLVITSLTGGVK